MGHSGILDPNREAGFDKHDKSSPLAFEILLLCLVIVSPVAVLNKPLDNYTLPPSSAPVAIFP